MKVMINFLLEANLALVFFYIIYWLLLRNESQFVFKRYYLVGSLIASLTFPFINISGYGTNVIPSLSNTDATLVLPEMFVYAENVTTANSNTFNIWPMIYVIYGIVCLMLLTLFLFRVFSLIQLFKKSKKYSWNKFKVAECEHTSHSFSFFHYIFLGQPSRLSELEKQEILNHEAAHSEQKHSFDILVINTVGILFWFNPIILFYKKALVQVHEFEADARSVVGRDVNEYCSLLAKVALQTNGYPIANHFTNSLTLKRIMMMKTVHTKIKKWKLGLLSITSLLLFIVVACQDQVMQDIQTITKNSSAATVLPAKVEAELIRLKSAAPQAEFIVMEMNEEGKKKMEEMDKDPAFIKTISSISIVKDAGQSFVILQKGEQTNMLANITATDDEVFTIVEESAQPAGGYDELYKYFAQQVKYPQEARNKGIEGKVYIEFIVNTNGTLSDIKILKGIGAGCDEEAARVVASSTLPWIPGKQRGIPVKQRLVIPIVFLLSPDKPAAIVIGEVSTKEQELNASMKKISENGATFLIGTVNNEDGQALSGTNIVVEGTTIGTVTGKDGAYKLQVPSTSGRVVISFIGYKSKTIAY